MSRKSRSRGQRVPDISGLMAEIVSAQLPPGGVPEGVRAAIQHNKALVRLIRLDHGLPVSLKRLRRA